MRFVKRGHILPITLPIVATLVTIVCSVVLFVGLPTRCFPQWVLFVAGFLSFGIGMCLPLIWCGCMDIIRDRV